MHPEAMEFINWALYTASFKIRDGEKFSVLEFGSRDVNGSPRSLFDLESTDYVGVDISPGPGVDIVGDAADVIVDIGATRHEFLECRLPRKFDVVICAEVAEHTPRWREIINNAARHLRFGGLFIFTAACDPRPPHSAIDGHDMAEGEYTWSSVMNFETVKREYYQNVEPGDLLIALQKIFREVYIATLPRGDVQATAKR